MIKKSKIIITLIFVLLVTNIYLVYNLNEVNDEMKIFKRSMLARADRAIDDAVGNIDTLNEGWEDKSDSEKIRILGEVDSNLMLAMELMNGADRLFLPIRAYRNGIDTLEAKIINNSDKNAQKEYAEGLNNDFKVLWKFLANFIYSDMTQEEAREKWKGEVEHLKTMQIKH